MSSNSKIEHMLTTLDNPFNPFTQFDRWNQYDCAKGYYTVAYLARVVDYTGCNTPEEEYRERERAIDEVIKLNPTHIYCKVTKDEVVKPIEL